MCSFDVVIAGDGVLALSIAFALSEKDASLSIAIVAPHKQMESASSAAGAMLGTHGEVTRECFENDFHHSKWNMSLEAQGLWEQWSEKLNTVAERGTKLILESPTRIIFNTQSGLIDSENYLAIERSLQLEGKVYEKCVTGLPSAYNPVTTSRSVSSILIPGEKFINPVLLLNILRAGLRRRRGVSFIENKVASVEIDHSKVSSLTFSDGAKVSVGQYVIAAGAYSGELIDQLGLGAKIPRLLAGVGLALVLKPEKSFPHELLRTPNRAGACGLHMVPYENGYIYVGATNHIYDKPVLKPKAYMPFYLLKHAIEQLDQSLSSAQIVRWLLGNRPVSVDAFPLLGETVVEGVYLATGSYREGIHHSPLIAQLISEQIIDRRESRYPEFLPCRPPISTMSRSDAIDKATRHLVAASHEHGMSIPYLGWSEKFEEMLHARFAELYKKLDMDIGIPPEILIFLDRERHLVSEFREYYHAALNAHYSIS